MFIVLGDNFVLLVGTKSLVVSYKYIIIGVGKATRGFPKY